MKYLKYILILCIIVATTALCKRKNDPNKVKVAEPEAVKIVPPASVEYTVDTIASVIVWGGSKPTGKHAGTIRIKKGEIFVKNDSLETGSFIINMESLKVTDDMEEKDRLNLENHLKGLKEGNANHFFNITKYPTGSFEITGIKITDNKNIIEGNLTLKDISKNIAFPSVIKISNDSIKMVSDKFTIDRTLWEINYSSKSAFENLGDQYINDNIEIRILIKAYRKSE